MIEKFRDHMQGSQFRKINEMLYTSSGSEAAEFFKSNRSAFSEYHEGYAAQMKSWPIDPVRRIADWIMEKVLRKAKKTIVIADMGCGDARLGEFLSGENVKVNSFDLVATCDRVTEAEISNVPLPDASVDICVFSLSLMGNNVSDFLAEARRILKADGRVKIIDVASRFTNLKRFSRQVSRIGYRVEKVSKVHRYFLEFLLSKEGQAVKDNLPNIELKPCWYKKR